MRVFENAKNFNVHGATFLEVGGDQNNYHHDQSLHVSGQNNNATYHNGPSYEGDRIDLGYNSGPIGVIAAGKHHNIGSQASQNPRPNANPPALPQGNRGNANPAGGKQDYYNGTHHRGDQVNLGHNAGAIGVIAVGQNHNISPQMPHSNEPRLTQSASEGTHVPQVHQSRPRQPETNSAPAVATMPAIQVDQYTQQRDASLHMPQPQVGDYTTAQNHASLGAAGPLSSPNAASSAGSISGATLTPSPLLGQTTSTPAAPSRASTPAPTGISPTVNESTAPVHNTADKPIFSEFPDVKEIPGHTPQVVSADQEKAKDKQAKKNTCFLKRLFRKSQKKKAKSLAETESEK